MVNKNFWNYPDNLNINRTGLANAQHENVSLRYVTLP